MEGHWFNYRSLHQYAARSCYLSNCKDEVIVFPQIQGHSPELAGLWVIF